VARLAGIQQGSRRDTQEYGSGTRQACRIQGTGPVKLPAAIFVALAGDALGVIR